MARIEGRLARPGHVVSLLPDSSFSAWLETPPELGDEVLYVTQTGKVGRYQILEVSTVGDNAYVGRVDFLGFYSEGGLRCSPVH